MSWLYTDILTFMVCGVKVSFFLLLLLFIIIFAKELESRVKFFLRALIVCNFIDILLYFSPFI